MSNVDTRPWTSQLLSVQNHYFSDFGGSVVGQQDDLEGAKTQKYHVNYVGKPVGFIWELS